MMKNRHDTIRGTVLAQALLLIVIVLLLMGAVLFIPQREAEVAIPAQRVRAAAHVGLLRLQAALINQTLQHADTSRSPAAMRPVRIDGKDWILLEDCVPIRVSLFALAPNDPENSWIVAVAQAVALDSNGNEIDETTCTLSAVIDSTGTLDCWHQTELEMNADGSYRLLDCPVPDLFVFEPSSGL